MQEKLTQEDIFERSNGPINLQIAVIDNYVVLELDKSTKWIALPKSMALEVAKGIISQANTIITD